MSFNTAVNPVAEENPDIGMSNRRRLILGSSAAVVAVAAITTTGVCAAGKCRKSRSVPPPTPPPNTFNPTPQLTSVSTLSPTPAPTLRLSDQPSDVPSLSPSGAQSQMPSDEPSSTPTLRASIAQTAVQNLEECSQTACFLVNLDTDAETLLTGEDTYSIDPEAVASYSIRCDAGGELAFVDFTYGGTTLREWNAPYYLNSNSEDWVEPVDDLSSCGDKRLTVSASTSADGPSCFEKSFSLTASCDGLQGIASSEVGNAVAAVEEECTLTGCYLLNLDTDTETLLTGEDTYAVDPQSPASYSVRCDSSQDLAFMDFTHAGTTKREWNAPYFMNSNSGDWVEPVDELSSCGDQTFVVAASKSSEGPNCVEETFALTAVCGEAPLATPTASPSSLPLTSQAIAAAVVEATEEEEEEEVEAVEQQEERCIVAKCFLLNIDTEVQTPLTGDDTYAVDSNDAYSIRCDPVQSDVDYIDFRHDGKNHRESNGPHWMNGNSGDSWVEPVEELSKCGDQSFRITVPSGGDCTEESFQLTALC